MIISSQRNNIGNKCTPFTFQRHKHMPEANLVFLIKNSTNILSHEIESWSPKISVIKPIHVAHCLISIVWLGTCPPETRVCDQERGTYPGYMW